MRLPAIVAALVSAAVFEALTVLATQFQAVRAGSPWQDDPYDVFVSFAVLAVPPLTFLVLVRLAAWRAPGGPDRAQQAARAAGALTVVAGLALAFEWGALAAGAHAADRNGWTPVLFGGLIGQSLLAAAAGVALWRTRSPRGAATGWRHDWLGDVAWLARRAAGPGVVAWVRRRATVVFAAASGLAAAAVVGAQSVGEGWTDPLLIGWAFVVVATWMFGFCVATNAVAGFIARPPRSRAAAVVEGSVLAGAVALTLMTAFRDPLWGAIAGHPVTTIGVLVALTVGAGLAAAGLTAAVLAIRPAGAAR